MKSVFSLMVFALAAWTMSQPVTTSCFPELGFTAESDTTDKRASPRKGFLDPSDNLIDTAFTLPKKLFAQNHSGESIFFPTCRVAISRSEV